jgi:hypothetical protein
MSRDGAPTDLEATVLSFLLGPDVEGMLSHDEVVRELGERDMVLAALARLSSKGLVHRLGSYVFATRAARRFDELRL